MLRWLYTSTTKWKGIMSKYGEQKNPHVNLEQKQIRHKWSGFCHLKEGLWFLSYSWKTMPQLTLTWAWLPYGLCRSGKNIVMTSSSNEMWWHRTSTRLFRTTWTRNFPRDGYVVQQPITSCGTDRRQDHQIQFCATSSCKTTQETWRSSCLLRYLCQSLRSELLHQSFHY